MLLVILLADINPSNTQPQEFHHDTERSSIEHSRMRIRIRRTEIRGSGARGGRGGARGGRGGVRRVEGVGRGPALGSVPHLLVWVHATVGRGFGQAGWARMSWAAFAMKTGRSEMKSKRARRVKGKRRGKHRKACPISKKKPILSVRVRNTISHCDRGVPRPSSERLNQFEQSSIDCNELECEWPGT
jgi:hypothetical protein